MNIWTKGSNKDIYDANLESEIFEFYLSSTGDYRTMKYYETSSTGMLPIREYLNYSTKKYIIFFTERTTAGIYGTVYPRFFIQSDKPFVHDLTLSPGTWIKIVGSGQYDWFRQSGIYPNKHVVTYGNDTSYTNLEYQLGVNTGSRFWSNYIIYDTNGDIYYHPEGGLIKQWNPLFGLYIYKT